MHFEADVDVCLPFERLGQQAHPFAAFGNTRTYVLMLESASVWQFEHQHWRIDVQWTVQAFTSPSRP
jgi:hypothetical protein